MTNAVPNRETYAIPPLASTADAEALERWMAAAEPGDRVLVAAGRAKPVASMAWLIAAGWERLGQAVLSAEPDGAGGWRWIAERAAATEAKAMAQRSVRGGAAREPQAPDGTAMSDFIFRAIARAANFNRPAPSLAELARAGGLTSAANAKYYVDKLKRGGSIDVELRQFSNGERRRYLILDRAGVATRQTDWGR